MALHRSGLGSREVDEVQRPAEHGQQLVGREVQYGGEGRGVPDPLRFGDEIGVRPDVVGRHVARQHLPLVIQDQAPGRWDGQLGDLLRQGGRGQLRALLDLQLDQACAEAEDRDQQQCREDGQPALGISGGSHRSTLAHLVGRTTPRGR